MGINLRGRPKNSRIGTGANLEVGSWKDMPHYAIVGNQVSFYVYIRKEYDNGGWYVPGEQGACNWITGAKAFKYYNLFYSFVKKRGREKFISLATQLHIEQGRVYHS